MTIRSQAWLRTWVVGLPTLLGGWMMITVSHTPTYAARNAAAAEVASQCSTSSAVSVSRAEPNAAEREVGRMLEQDQGQRRPRIVFNPVLARVARQRAEDMAARNYFDHTDPDGLGANTHVTRAGYQLPDFYNRSPAGNNIESIGAGYRSPTEAWQGWMSSTGHRTHLLGLQDFYRDQSEYGIGYAHAPGTEYVHYWVVLIAKPAC